MASITFVDYSGTIPAAWLNDVNTLTYGGTWNLTVASITVNGNAAMTGTLGVGGATTLGSLAVTNNATVGGTLGVTGATTVNSLSVTNNASVGGALTVTGNQTVTGNLTVTGSVSSSSSAVGGFKNFLDNGAFDIWQRGAGVGTTVSAGALGVYYADRWIVYTLGSNCGVSKNPGNGFTQGTNAMLLTGSSTPAPNTYVDLIQRIESANVGKFKNSNCTISAKIYNSTGGTIAANSLIFTVNTPGSGSPDAWPSCMQRYGVNITHAAIPNGTWLTVSQTFNPSAYTNVLLGMEIHFRYTGLVAGQLINWSEIQLEIGSAATSFEQRPYGYELMNAQRFYWVVQPTSNNFFAMGYNNSTSQAYINIAFPVKMRAVPVSIDTSGTASDYGVLTGVNTVTTCTSVPALYAGTASNMTVTFGTAATLTNNSPCIGASPTGFGYIAFRGAEL